MMIVGKGCYFATRHENKVIWYSLLRFTDGTLSFDNMLVSSSQEYFWTFADRRSSMGLFELAAASLNGFLGDVPDPDVHPPKFAAPEDLLAYLGMEEWEDRKPEEQKAWLTWSEQEMSAAGFDVPSLVEAAETPFDAVLMDAMFANERLAIGILNTNFRRLDQSMRNVAVAVSNVSRQFSDQSDTPLCIAELGGGCGLLSMWLLLCQNGKQRRCRVYDYSRNNLAVGEAWAHRLGLEDCLSFHLGATR